MFRTIEKLGLIGMLICVATIVAPSQTIKTIDAFFDPTTNETTVYLSRKYVPLTTYQPEGYIPPDGGTWVEKPEGLVLTVFFKSPGKRPTVPETIRLAFESRSSGDFRYKNDRRLVVKADDETFDLGELRLVKGEVDRSSRGMRATYFEENLEASVKLDDYSRIVSARKVQMSVGKTKVRLSEKNLKELRSYIERLKS